MATTGKIAFTRTVVQGFYVQVASRRLDLPAVGYLAADGTIVQDYTKGEKFQTQALAQTALTALKSAMTPDLQASTVLSVTNKIVLMVAS